MKIKNQPGYRPVQRSVRGPNGTYMKTMWVKEKTPENGDKLPAIGDQEPESSLPRTAADRKPGLQNLTSKLDAYDAELEELKKKVKRKAVTENEDEFHRLNVKIADLTRERHLLNAEINDWKNETAEQLADESEACDQELIEHDSDTLGDATLLGDYSEDRAEWRRARQAGIGGSDFLKAAGFKAGSNNNLLEFTENEAGYALQELIYDKTEEIDGEETLTDAQHRGNVWEPIIANAYAEQTGSTVLKAKGTWQGDAPWAIVNVDGLISEDNGKTISGILECKTSAKEWENGVPLGYRAQTLYYLENTGLDYADIAVVTNDSELTVHRINSGDPLGEIGGEPVTMTEAMVRANITWSKITQAKETKAPVIKPRRSRIKDDPREVTKAVKNISAILGEDEETTRAAIKSLRETGLDTDEAVRAHLRNKFDPARSQKMLFIDGETATIVRQDEVFGSQDRRPFAPAYSDWIESGAVLANGQGDTISEFNELYAPNENTLKHNGTGREDIHGINPGDLKGKALFTDDGPQERLNKVIDEADVLIAHNARFETGMLNSKLKGFKQRNKPVIDSLWVAKHFLPENDTDGNKLEDLCKAYDVPYEGAHRALEDSKLLQSVLKKMWSNSDWIDRRVTT